MIYQEYWGKEGLWFLSQVSGPTGSSLKGRGSAHLLEKRKNARRWRATSTCGRYAADALHLLNTFLLHTSGRYGAECRASPATQGTRGSSEWCDTPVCVHPVTVTHTPPPPHPLCLCPWGLFPSTGLDVCGRHRSHEGKLAAVRELGPLQWRAEPVPSGDQQGHLLQSFTGKSQIFWNRNRWVLGIAPYFLCSALTRVYGILCGCPNVMFAVLYPI